MAEKIEAPKERARETDGERHAGCGTLEVRTDIGEHVDHQEDAIVHLDCFTHGRRGAKLGPMSLYIDGARFAMPVAPTVDPAYPTTKKTFRGVAWDNVLKQAVY